LDPINLKNSKPKQKFFEKYLNNDLSLLTSYLLEIEKDLIFTNKFSVPSEIQNKFKVSPFGATTAMFGFYNIFTFDNLSIKNLKNALADLTKEACEYYGIDYESSNYMINGWFNVDYGTAYGNAPYDPDKTENFHDHGSGSGAPVFHGYYCVNAEPSSTFYLIDRKTNFENINKNNRLILSETGHPHNIGNWEWEGPRITIAYDIAPKHIDYVTDSWIYLND
jgi:hypothetical protein